jgi:MoaA/NifB/PqqE/SkfB family radical SAM enzyme
LLPQEKDLFNKRECKGMERETRHIEDQEFVCPQSGCLAIEITTRCNSSCSHCFVRARGARKLSLAPNLVRMIVREGYEAGYRDLHITGGEPLIWDGLLGIFEYAITLGYQKAFLNTNGTLLTGKISRKLARYKGLTISVTLQGPKRFHDRIRGKGSYDRALKGIIQAIDAGLAVHVFTPVGRSLIPEMPRFAEKLFIKLPDIQQLSLIQLIRVPGDLFDLSKEVLSPCDFLRLVRMISFLNLYGLSVDLLNNPLAAVASKALKMPWVSRSPPLYRAGSVMITAERRITAAHSAMDHFGIYKPGMLSTIFSSDKYRRAVSQDQSTCGDCLYLNLCSKEGMIRPSEWYRDMFPEVPYCRRVLAKASSYG